MINRINELIDINLKLICESKRNEIYTNDFLHIDEKRMFARVETDNFAYEMESRNLIRKNGYLCTVTEFGYEIFKSGGWLKYVEATKKNKEKELIKAEEKESLDSELKILQRESLEYQIKIRDQSDRIRDLDEQIKMINLLKEYWWFIGVCILIGGLLKEFLERIGILT
jgi:hypothetical protein